MNVLLPHLVALFNRLNNTAFWLPAVMAAPDASCFMVWVCCSAMVVAVTVLLDKWLCKRTTESCKQHYNWQWAQRNRAGFSMRWLWGGCFQNEVRFALCHEPFLSRETDTPISRSSCNIFTRIFVNKMRYLNAIIFRRKYIHLILFQIIRAPLRCVPLPFAIIQFYL